MCLCLLAAKANATTFIRVDFKKVTFATRNDGTFYKIIDRLHLKLI